MAGGAVGPGIVGDGGGGEEMRSRGVGSERTVEVVVPGVGWGAVLGGEVEGGEAA